MHTYISTLLELLPSSPLQDLAYIGASCMPSGHSTDLSTLHFIPTCCQRYKPDWSLLSLTCVQVLHVLMYFPCIFWGKCWFSLDCQGQDKVT